jgi:wobble nucleotide-excising tRNase
MTHNGHFYIQLLYKSGKKAGRVHLVKSSVNGVEFNVIEKEEDDIKTCYEMLWRDLRSVFESDKTSSEMLKNQMRRIIETYTMFTCKEKESFCNKVPDGFQTLFDVGSHGLDDLEYAGESHEKEELLEIFKLIFEKNGAKEHFEYLWSQNKIK